MNFIISAFFCGLVTLLIICSGLLIFMDLHNDYKKIKGTKRPAKNKLRIIK